MQRSRAIDILRAFAVLLVMGRHIDLRPAKATSETLYHFSTVWKTGGWVGVDLFFVLSGFLVAGLLFKEHARHGIVSAKNFLIRRGFKLYPAFWVMTLTSATMFVLLHFKFKPLAVVCDLLLVQNYGWALWSHTWSLAVEEHFYLFLVLVLSALVKWRGGKNPFRMVPLIFVILAVTCLVLRLATAGVSPVFIDKSQLYPTHLRMDSLFCGVLLAYLYHQDTVRFMDWARRWRWALVAAGVALLAPAFCFELSATPFIYTFGLTEFYIGSACLMVGMLGMEIPANFLTKGVAYIGSHSYSIYLWHLPTLWWVVPHLVNKNKDQRNWFVYTGVWFASSIVVGVVMAAAVEFPMLRLRDRLFPSRDKLNLAR